MRSQKGSTFLDLLTVVVSLGIIAVLVVGVLIPVRRLNQATKFTLYFEIDVNQYVSEAQKSKATKNWLTPEQKKLLRPWVERRLADLKSADESSAWEYVAELKTREARILANHPTDVIAVISALEQLKELDAEIEVAQRKALQIDKDRDEVTAKAQAIAGAFDILTDSVVH